MILEHPPVPLRAHRPDAPEGLERVLRKALEKQPARPLEVGRRDGRRPSGRSSTDRGRARSGRPLRARRVSSRPSVAWYNPGSDGSVVRVGHEGGEPWSDSGTVAIVGVGLIGGSIGLALRARGLAERVVGSAATRPGWTRPSGSGPSTTCTTDLAPGRGRGRRRGRLHAGHPDRRGLSGRRASTARPALLVTDAGSTKRRSSRRSSATPAAAPASSAATRSPAPSGRGPRTPTPTSSRAAPAS